MLTVIAAGFTEGSLTRDAYDALRECANIVLHTERCGAAALLRSEGRSFKSLDDLYENCPDFDSHNAAVLARLKEECAKGDTAYVVFDLRDETVRALVREGFPARLVPGPAEDGILEAYTTGAPAVCLAAGDVTEETALSPFCDTLVREIDSRILAGTVKLALLDAYPEDTQIRYTCAGRAPQTAAITDLDRLEGYDHTFSVLVPACRDLTKLDRYDANALERLVRRLTRPDGCPWDSVQTHESMRGALIEESYEAAEAIDDKDDDALADELGDVLYNVMLHADIAQRHGSFCFADVVTAVAKKLIRRHPFVFADGTAGSAQEALAAWDEAKKKEKSSGGTNMVASVARTLPSMTRAAKLIARSGMPQDPAKCLKDLAERASSCGGEEAVGDMLFAAARYAASVGSDPEAALRGACDRFQNKYERQDKERRNDEQDTTDRQDGTGMRTDSCTG